MLSPRLICPSPLVSNSYIASMVKASISSQLIVPSHGGGVTVPQLLWLTIYKETVFGASKTKNPRTSLT
jgi:hypothetical protein